MILKQVPSNNLLYSLNFIDSYENRKQKAAANTTMAQRLQKVFASIIEYESDDDAAFESDKESKMFAEMPKNALKSVITLLFVKNFICSV